MMALAEGTIGAELTATLSGFNNPEDRMNVGETLKRPLQFLHALNLEITGNTEG
jgi:hypothetical protein